MCFLETVGAPTSLDRLGVTKNLAIGAFVGVWEYRPERYTILHKRHPNNLDAERVIEEIGV